MTEMANQGLWASHPEAKAPEIESVVTIANEPDSILLPAVPRADQPEPETARDFPTHPTAEASRPHGLKALRP